MKYFLHDTNAFQDEKLTELFIRFGYEGIGLFFIVLERLAAQEKPIKTIVLKKQLSVGKKLEKVWAFMEEIGLISSNNGETFNENLLKFSEKYKVQKEKTRERVAKFRENQVDRENVTRYNRVSNAPKVKVSKVKDTNVSMTATPESNTGAIDTAVKKNGNGQMIKPDLVCLTEYVLSREGGTETMAVQMFDFYTSKGWKVGSSPMADWNAAARKWVANNTNPNPTLTPRPKSMVV